MQDSVLMCLPSAAGAEIDNHCLPHIVQGTHFDAATSIVTFKRLRDLDWTPRSLVSAVRRLLF